MMFFIVWGSIALAIALSSLLVYLVYGKKNKPTTWILERIIDEFGDETNSYYFRSDYAHFNCKLEEYKITVKAYGYLAITKKDMRIVFWPENETYEEYIEDEIDHALIRVKDSKNDIHDLYVMCKGRGVYFIEEDYDKLHELLANNTVLKFHVITLSYRYSFKLEGYNKDINKVITAIKQINK